MSNTNTIVSKSTTINTDLKDKFESFYYKLSDQIKDENTNFRKILESLDVLESNNIIAEADEGPANKTMMDKLLIIFKKVCLFFSKIKNEVYKKFINVAYQKTYKYEEEILKKMSSNHRDTEKRVKANFYWISDESVDNFKNYMNATEKICNQLNDAYDNSDLEKANNIDFDKLPELKINIDNDSFECSLSDSNISQDLTIRNNLSDAKAQIEVSLKEIEHLQQLLTRKLKIKDINHNQMRISSKMIDIFNYETKAVYKYINACIKAAFLQYKELQKLEAKLK